MNKALSYPLFFFLLGLSIYVVPVHAEGAVDLSSFPQYLATQFGISLFVAQLMASVILDSLFLFPVLMLVRGKKQEWVMTGIFGISLLSLNVAIGWLPVWSFAVIILFIGFGAAIFFGRYGG